MVIRRSALHSAFILIASFFNPLWKPCRTPGRPAISNSNQNTNRNIRHCYFVLRTLNINLLFPDWQRALGGRLLQQQHNMDKHMWKGSPAAAQTQRRKVQGHISHALHQEHKQWWESCYEYRTEEERGQTVAAHWSNGHYYDSNRGEQPSQTIKFKSGEKSAYNYCVYIT